MTPVLKRYESTAMRASLPHNIVARSFVAETVLLDVNTGRYFKLDRVAGCMLDAALGADSLAAAGVGLAERGLGTAAEVLTDLMALCAELSAMGLLRFEAAA